MGSMLTSPHTLGGLEFCVGVPGRVIDRDVQMVLAEATPTTDVRAVAVHAMPDCDEAIQRLRVEVHELPLAPPLGASGRRTTRRRLHS
jgi:hypothetical protein